MDEKKQTNSKQLTSPAKQSGEQQKEQAQPTRWYCDTDCRAANRACRGEKGKDPTAKNLCPYYEDMLF